MVNKSQTKEVMTTVEACNYLSCSRTLLWQLKKKGILVPKIMGKRPRYLLSDVMAYLEGKPAADNQQDA